MARVFSTTIGAALAVLAFPAHAQWSALSSPSADTLRSVQFLDDSTGYVVGYNVVVRKTVDGGLNWTPQQASGAPVGSRLLGLSFADANNGFISAGQYVARTTNGGANWTALMIDTNAAIFRNSGFATAGNVYWVPASGGGQRWFYRYTVDGNGISMEQAFDTVMSGSPFLAMHFVDADNGWAVGFSSLIRRITNASTASPGFAFQSCNNCLGATLNGIFMLDANRGWLVGTGATIRATTDGGTTWNPQTSPVNATLRNVHFSDAMNGFIVGDGGLILATSDGGANWVQETSTVSTALFDVHALAGPAYAVGGDLASSANGVALKRSDVFFADGFENP